MALQHSLPLPIPLRNILTRYGVALTGVLLATLIRWWLHPLLGDQYPFPTFFIVVILTAQYVGLGPALSALLLGCLIGTRFFLSPLKSSFGPLAPGLFLAVGAISAVVCDSLRRARDT